MKKEDLWEYIETHQDEETEEIAALFNIPKSIMKNLVVRWAVDDLDTFNKVLSEL